ncbi:MAG: class I SAM-dependent methyltransferase, partial [Curvibacter sp.]|nr:class I SAM-dependent methyltransferase [Curvibacter sp.]
MKSLPPTTQHVYFREVLSDERSSLTLLAEQIPAGSTVLDLGCGTGALGRFLKQTKGCLVDGLTINEMEAALARDDYRQVHVANLEQCDLAAVFPLQGYDYIVCADVLEHLQNSARILDQCKPLLATNGQLLISVPNVSYFGLVTELMEGKFSYRDEGILDRTHLRFFTRGSLLDFLGQSGWAVETLSCVRKEIIDSEFRPDFQKLPYAITRSIGQIPDALTYQFVASARPGQHHNPTVLAPIEAEAQPLFVAQLFWSHNTQFTEDQKTQQTGVMGKLQQTLSFTIPQDALINKMRLDLADRPGFLHLHALRIRGKDNQILWTWDRVIDGFEPLMNCEHSEIWFPDQSLFSDNSLILLLGNDPWLHLPSQLLPDGARID